MNDTIWMTYESPLGPLTLCGGTAGLTALEFSQHGEPRAEHHHAPELFTRPAQQLDEYFAGERQDFDLTLDLGGTPFQRRVWRALLAIPFGTTTTYTELARAVGRPDIVRAVGGAVGRTPVPIIVPCHRVIGRDGTLTGYRGGLERKRALLELEHAASAQVPPPCCSPRQLAPHLERTARSRAA